MDLKLEGYAPLGRGWVGLHIKLMRMINVHLGLKISDLVPLRSQSGGTPV